MAAADSLQATIDAAWDAAADMMDVAEGYSNQAMSAASGIIWPAPFHEIEEPTIPAILVPPTGLDSTFTNVYDASMAELKQEVDDRLDDFIATYYPDYTAKLATISDWIDNTIKNGGTGLPVAIEQAIWDRARAREDAKATGAETDIFNTFAARGFPMPVGAQAQMLREIQQSNQNAVNALSRDIAIKQAELELENIKFAIQTGASLHIAVISAATNYMNVIINIASSSNAKASSLVNAIVSLYNMSISYNNAVVSSEGLMLRYDTTAYERDHAANALDVETYYKRAETKVNAALAAAQQMGNVAAAAIGSQNTMATLSNNTEE